MTVLLVAASLAVRDRLRHLLAGAGVRVSGERGSVRDAVRTGGADAIVVGDGALLEAAENLEADIPVPLVVVSEDHRAGQMLRELDLPGWALLPPDADGEELRAAILLASAGLVVMPTGVVRARRGGADDEDEEMGARESLTARESEVLERLADGLSNREIGAALGISEHTAKFHVASVLAKLGAANRAEAVRQGLRRGLLTV